MKTVRGALRALKAQVLQGGAGTPPRIFFLLACSNMFLCTFEVSFTVIIGLRHV